MGVGAPPFLLSDIQQEIEGSTSGAYSLSTADSKYKPGGLTAPTLMSEYDFYVHRGSMIGEYTGTPTGTPQIKRVSQGSAYAMNSTPTIEYSHTSDTYLTENTRVDNGGAAYKSFDGVTATVYRRPKSDGAGSSGGTGWTFLTSWTNYTSTEYTSHDFGAYDYKWYIQF